MTGQAGGSERPSRRRGTTDSCPPEAARCSGSAEGRVTLPGSGIKEGINLLAGASDGAALEIGFSTTWRPLRRGVVVAIRAPAAASAGYRIDEHDGRLLRVVGGPVTDQPYLALEITAEPQRDDWASIPELAAGWADVQREYRAGDATRTGEALTAFRRIALTW
jgi:hypothetical protein